MFKRPALIIALTFLLVGCYFAPLNRVSAAEDEKASATAENPQGAGVVILMGGLAAILLVGGFYTSQQGQKPSES